MIVTRLALDSLVGAVKRPDVFICCGSYELRSRSIPDRLAPELPRHVLIVENVNLSAYVEESVHYIANRFHEKSERVEIDSANPIVTADRLSAALSHVREELGPPINYLVDITTFTHESLLILLQLLQMTTKVPDSVTFCYCSAAEYSIGLPSTEKWLTKGVLDVRSILGFPGRVLPWRKDHLVILVGYEYERASKLIEVLEPNVISLGHGTREGSTAPKHYEANSHFHKLIKQIAAKNAHVNSFLFSCDNPYDTRDRILAQADLQPDYNVIVAPMNTKISTVGCALAAFERPELQICYAQAMAYNYAHYSSPGDNCYVFELPGIIPNAI